MKAPVRFLALGFAAATLSLGYLAWRQHGELVELRAAALNRDERADLQRRLWDLEKQNRDLQARVVAAGGDAAASGAPAGPEPGGPTGVRPGRGGPRGGPESGLRQAAAMRELLSRPDVQALVQNQQRAGIASRYAPLFKNLNLSSEQIDRLSALLVERGTTQQDAFMAAREQGVDPRANPDAMRQLLADVQAPIDASLKALLGESGYAQLQHFEQTQPQRAVVGELQARLSYTSSPLSATQSEQLVQILAANAPLRPPAAPAGPAPGAGPPPPGGGRGPGLPELSFIAAGPGPGGMPPGLDAALRAGAAPVTDGAIAQSQTVLTAAQLTALQELQQQQKAQQQLQQLVRETLSPGATPGTPGGTPPPASSRPSGKR